MLFTVELHEKMIMWLFFCLTFQLKNHDGTLRNKNCNFFLFRNVIFQSRDLKDKQKSKRANFANLKWKALSTFYCSLGLQKLCRNWVKHQWCG